MKIGETIRFDVSEYIGEQIALDEFGDVSVTGTVVGTRAKGQLLQVVIPNKEEYNFFVPIENATQERPDVQ